MKHILTISLIFLSSYSFSQVVVKVPQQDISGKLNKTDTAAMLSPYALKNSVLPVSTDSSFANASDDSVSSSLAVKKFVRQRADSLGWFVATKYGAVGDSATDNTAAIQALFNAVPASGGTVYFPHGIYLVSDSIVIPRKCRIIGDGQGKTYSQIHNYYSNSGSIIIQTKPNTNLFVVNGQGVSFEFLGLKNNVDNPSAGAGILFNEGREFHLNKIRVENFYVNVNVRNGDLWSIGHSYFQDAVLYNLQIADSASSDAGDASITSSWFFAGKYAGTTNIRYLSGGGLKIINCKLHGSPVTPFANAPLYDIDASDIQSTSILLLQNNSFEYFRNGAIKVSNAAGKSFAKIIIHGNQIYPVGNIPVHSINITGISGSGGGLSEITIANNIIDIVNDTLSAVYVNNVSGGNISGNVFSTGHSNTDSLVNCTNFSFIMQGTAYLPNISNSAGNFVTVATNGALTYRTAAQVLTDIGAASSIDLLNTNKATYETKLDLSAKSSFASVDYIFPGGSSSSGTGILRHAQVGVLGTSDIFLQLLPLTTASYGYVEAFNSAGLVLGTGNDANNTTAPIIFRPNRIEVGRITKVGNLLMNTTTDDGINKIQANGGIKATQYKLSALNTAPSSATDTGTTGEIRVTAGYIYVCTATNTWVRAALSTW